MHLPAFPRPRRRITLWLAALIAAGSLVTATAATLRAGVDTAKVVKKATPRFVEALLDKLELDYKATGKNGYLIKLDTVKILAFIEDDGSLMLYCSFQGVKIGTAKTNEWNKKHRYSRAYVDDSNDPILESDLDFNGGVTLESLKNFLTTFKASALGYKKFLAP